MAAVRVGLYRLGLDGGCTRLRNGNASRLRVRQVRSVDFRFVSADFISRRSRTSVGCAMGVNASVAVSLRYCHAVYSLPRSLAWNNVVQVKVRTGAPP